MMKVMLKVTKPGWREARTMNKPQITHFADEHTLARLAKLEAVAEVTKEIYAGYVGMDLYYLSDEEVIRYRKLFEQLRETLAALEGGQDDA
jgi:hypothetical protein